MAQAALLPALWSHAAVWFAERLLDAGVHGVYLVTRLTTWAADIGYTAVDSVALWLAVPFFALGLVVAIRAAFRAIVGAQDAIPAGGIRPKGCS